MLKSLRYLIGLLTLVLLAAAVAAVGVRGQAFTTMELHGQPWPVAVDSTSPQVLDIDANAQDEMIATLADGRLMRIAADGQLRFEAAGNTPSKPLKAAFVDRDHRWVISKTQAVLLDATGRDVGGFRVPRGATASLVLSDGNLAFLKPRGPSLVSVTDQYGAVTAEFGDPIEAPNVSAAQSAWLNEATLLEATGHEIIVAFSHQPYPTVRRYARSGRFLGETTLRSPGLDRIAADAIARMAEVPSSCSGGLTTVFGVAYDRLSDTVWVASASDDAVGFVRVLDSVGNVVAQMQLTAAGSTAPAVPTSMKFGGHFLFWMSGAQIYRTDVSGIRTALRRPFLQPLVSRLVATVHRGKIRRQTVVPPKL